MVPCSAQEADRKCSGSAVNSPVAASRVHAAQAANADTDRFSKIRGNFAGCIPML